MRKFEIKQNQLKLNLGTVLVCDSDRLLTTTAYNIMVLML